MVDRADALNLVGEQVILLVEKKHAKFLVVEEGHRGAAIIDDAGETESVTRPMTSANKLKRAIRALARPDD